MKSLENIKKMVKKFEINPDPEMKKSVLTDAVEMQKLRRQNLKFGGYIWEIAMGNKIVKLAASLLIVAAVGASFALMNKTVEPAYAISDLPGLYADVSTLYLKGCGYLDEKGVTVELPYEFWIDFDRGAMRRKVTALYSHDDGPSTTEQWELFINDGQRVKVNHAAGEVEYSNIGEYFRGFLIQKKYGELFNPYIDIFRNTDGFTMVGYEMVNGVRCEFWQGEYTGSETDTVNKIECWFDAYRGQLCRLRSWRKKGDEQFRLSSELFEVKRDTEFTESCFAYNPIEGYRDINTPETANLYTGQDCTLILTNGENWLDIYESFVLGNGCVISNWRCHEGDVENRDELWQGVSFGDDIPLDDVSIVALEGIKLCGDKVKYEGKHLTSMYVNGEISHWSIYVPESPDCSDVMSYNLVMETKDADTMWGYELNINASMPVEDEHDFNKWVLGMMAAISDDGVVPPEITYENVMNLCQSK